MQAKVAWKMDGEEKKKKLWRSELFLTRKKGIPRNPCWDPLIHTLCEQRLACSEAEESSHEMAFGELMKHHDVVESRRLIY